MNKTTRITATLVTLGTMTLLGACSSSPNDNEAATPVAENKPLVNKKNWPEPVPTTGLAKGLTLPLEEYMASYRDNVTWDKATRVLQEKCMSDYGFSIDLPEAGVTPPPSDNDANMKRRYGITDPAIAREHGYGLPEALTQQHRQHMPNLSGVQVEVLTGHTKPEPISRPAPEDAKKEDVKPGPGAKVEPARKEYLGKKIHPGGCLGWSKNQLGTERPDLTFVSSLAGDSLLASKQTEEVQAAIAKWSSCMADKGHKGLADPYEAMDRGVAPAGQATEDSINLAMDDIACKKTTDLVTVWFEVESEIQRHQIADNEGRLEPLKAQHRKAIKAAHTHVSN